MMNRITPKARATTATWAKWMATASMIRVAPRVAALVVACIRVSRSGRRTRPSAASSMNSAPIRISPSLSISVIPGPSPLQETREADGGHEGHQCHDDGHVEQTRHVGGDGHHPDDTDRSEERRV